VPGAGTELIRDVAAGGYEAADGVAAPHALHSHAKSRQLAAISDFAPMFRGWRGSSMNGPEVPSCCGAAARSVGVSARAAAALSPPA
jgi:hypothetical protein